MKKTPRHFLIAAAITGLLGGAAVNQGYGETTNTAPGKVAPAKKEPKVHDCAGSNDCKALGGCKTGDNGCKFKNSCKGKGGCAITEKDISTWKAAQKTAKS
jgi:hypothetical protein